MRNLLTKSQPKFKKLEAIISNLLNNVPLIYAILPELIKLDIEIAMMTNNIQLDANEFKEKSKNIFVFFNRLYCQNDTLPLLFFHKFADIDNSASFVDSTHTNAKISLTTLGDCYGETYKVPKNQSGKAVSIKAKKGSGKVIIATAKKLLGIIYNTLKNNWMFENFEFIVEK